MKQTLFLVAILLFATVGFADAKNFSKRFHAPSSASEVPPFSAFARNGILYVTVLGDCNDLQGNLEVAPECKQDRDSKNRAVECDAKLRIMQTATACKDKEPVVRVALLNLAKEDVATEAHLLHLHFGVKEVDVVLK